MSPRLVHFESKGADVSRLMLGFPRTPNWPLANALSFRKKRHEVLG